MADFFGRGVGWVAVWLRLGRDRVRETLLRAAFPPTRESQQGWAMSCALLGCRFGALSSGILSDRLGRKLS
jgi:MFS family permease